MYLADVGRAIHGQQRCSYRVHFEWVRGNVMEGDSFPDHAEQPLMDESQALDLAKKFADSLRGKVINVQVWAQPLIGREGSFPIGERLNMVRLGEQVPEYA